MQAMGREKRLGIVLLTAVLVACNCASPAAEALPAEQEQDGYVESRRSEDNNICTYNFAGDHQFFQGDQLQKLTLSAVVKVNIHSVGTFQGYMATKYCMNVADVATSGLHFDDEIIGKEEQQAVSTKLFDGQFCFVQTENGRIVEVHSEEGSHPEGLNLKKTIAAAFQAHFHPEEDEEQDTQADQEEYAVYEEQDAQTDLNPEEDKELDTQANFQDQDEYTVYDEQDPQSLHTAHYRYEDTDDEDHIKMHRSVSSDDVKEYSTGAHVKHVKLQKEEDIEYRSGRLHHSSGTTSIEILGSQQRIEGRPVELQEGPLSDKLLSASGSYSLDLLHCQKSPSSTRGRRDARKPMTKDSLKAVVSKEAAAKAEMKDLRTAMPLIPQALAEIRANPENHKLVNQLERLLVLESEYGPLPGYTPALHAVINFLVTMGDSVKSEDEATKSLLYSLLSVEGSFQAQKTLIQAMGDASSEAERVNIIASIAFIRGAHPAILEELEQQKTKSNDYLDPLFLAYGALASETTTANEQRIVTFLLSQLQQAPTNTTILVHFIHALGNAGSNYALDTIVTNLNHSTLQVQLVSISAMRKLINNPLVEDLLLEMLQAKPVSMEHVVEIAETLIAGFKYLDEKEVDYTPSLSLQMALVASTLQFGDVELAELVLSFVENFGDKSTNELVNVLKQEIADGKESSFQTRVKRGTDWDKYNSYYDLVASHSSRVADVRNYPKHKAYIYGKQIGVSKANLKFGFGVFMGINPSCPIFKAFGKVAAEANVLRWKWNIIHGEVLLEKNNDRLTSKVYLKILSNVLINYKSVFNFKRCYRPKQTLYSSKRYSPGRVSYKIFVYVGTLSLYIQPHIQAHLDSRQELCTNGLGISALAGIGPRITFIVEGGVSGNLLGLARGGVAVELKLEYKIESIGKGRLCSSCTKGKPITIRPQGCVGVFHGWPNNQVLLYAWYQLKRVKFCSKKIWGKKFKYPCGLSWGSRNKWNKFSKTWNLAKLPMKEIYGNCKALRSPTCPR